MSSKSFHIRETDLIVKFFCAKHHINISFGRTGKRYLNQWEYQIVYEVRNKIYTSKFYESKPFNLYDVLYSIGCEYLNHNVKPFYNKVFDKFARFDLMKIADPNHAWYPPCEKDASHPIK